jgi:hypothetical protein
MNGASLLPRICPWLWFSITMVNTVPRQAAGRLAAVVAIGRHATSVLPEVLGPPHAARSNGKRRRNEARETYFVRCIFFACGAEHIATGPTDYVSLASARAS